MNRLAELLDSDVAFLGVMLIGLAAGLSAAAALARVIREATPEARQMTWLNPANVVFYPSLLTAAGRDARRRFFVSAFLAFAVPWLYFGLS